MSSKKPKRPFRRLLGCEPLEDRLVLSSGPLHFDAPVLHAAGASAFDVLAVDFNRDGVLDLAVANCVGYTQGTITLLNGQQDGGFSQPRTIADGVGGAPAALASGDFNNDGKPDLAVANSSQ